MERAREFREEYFSREVTIFYDRSEREVSDLTRDLGEAGFKDVKSVRASLSYGRRAIWQQNQ